MENSKSKIITDVAIARSLIRMGNRVIDIKPRHDNPVATVFVFLDDDKFESDLSTIIKGVK